MSIDTLYTAVSIFLLLNALVGLIRVSRGPSRGDRMLATQLFGTLGVAIMLLLAESLGRPPLRDVALVLVLLTVINAVVFVRFAAQSNNRAKETGT